MFKRLAIIFYTVIFVCSALLLCGCANDLDKEYAYYTQHLNEKINRIKAIQDEHEIAESFFFITDLHWEANYKHSPYLVQKVKKATGINKINFGGDYTAQDYEDTQEALDWMKQCIKSFNVAEYYAILGNHELNTQHWRGTPEISFDDSNKVVNDNRFEAPYFYVANEENKIIGIYLNSNDLSSDIEQKTWFTSLITSYDEGWTALIFSHMFYTESATDGIRRHSAGEALNDLILTNRDDIQCSIAGVFSGHVHTDNLQTYDNFYTATATMCDCSITYSLHDYERSYRTAEDQAFDVVQVDTSAKHVYLTRIGAGSDREYDY